MNNGHTLEGIAARGDNQLLQLSSIPSPTSFINPHTWSNLDGRNVTVWEIQFVGTGECMNSVLIGHSPALFGIYEESCVSSDTNEWFWQAPTGSSTNGVQNFWYRNAGATTQSNSRTYVYMTASGYSQGSVINGLGPGAGGRAEWNRSCVSNC